MDFDWKLWLALIATAGACLAILIAYGEHRDADRQRKQKWAVQSNSTRLGIENRRLRRELNDAEVMREMEQRAG